DAARIVAQPGVQPVHAVAGNEPGQQGTRKQDARDDRLPRQPHDRAVRSPARTPRFETTNGTTKLRQIFTTVSDVASPRAITSPWLISVSTQPTTSAILTVFRRFDGERHVESAARQSSAVAVMPAAGLARFQRRRCG